MILNGYSVLGLGSCALRLVIAALLLGTALRRGRTEQAGQDERTRNRRLLASMLALILAGLAAASWPLLYATLQSYVRQWPGTMCVYGVLQVGSGSGSRLAWLPLLAQTVQWLKPLLVFAAGTWLVLRYMDYHTPQQALHRAALGSLLFLGGVGFVDALLEGAYLAAPKSSATPSLGCCVLPLSMDHANPGPVARMLSGLAESQIRWGFYGLTIAVAGLLKGLPRLQSAGAGSWAQTVTLILAALAESFALPLFLARSVTPQVLKKPGNFCPYDLLPVSPGAVAGVVLVLIAVMCIGWSIVAQRVPAGSKAPSAMQMTAYETLHRRLTSVGASCLLGALISFAAAARL